MLFTEWHKTQYYDGSIVILGALITVGISYFGDIKTPVAVGLFSGATTNTPSLVAAQEILGGMSSFDSETLKHPRTAYYP